MQKCKVHATYMHTYIHACDHNREMDDDTKRRRAGTFFLRAPAGVPELKAQCVEVAHYADA